MCAPAGWERGGGGVWAETTPGSSFLCWPEGAGGEEGHGERGGLEEGLRTQAEGFREKAGAPASGLSELSPAQASKLKAQQWPRGGAQPLQVLRGNRDPHSGGVSSGPASPVTTPGASSVSSLCLDSATGYWGPLDFGGTWTRLWPSRMPSCPPQQSRNRVTQLPALELGDMELTWQEIMSITELQGLNAPSESSFEPQALAPYPGPPPPPAYCPCSVHPDTGFSLPPPPYEVPASTSHVPEPPYSYGNMAIPVSKSLTLSGLLNEPLPDPLALLDIGLSAGPPKPQEDPESDSGLSLNYSDAESLELEGTEASRRRNEYVEMYPVEYPYSLMPNSLAHSNYTLPPAETPLALEPSSGPVRAKSTARGEAGSRDERRALAMKIPFPTDKIVNLPVDDFNELLARYPLTESQLALVRDIRRRGKNKVAAQNCRKRKLETIVQLERELERLGSERERLLRARGEADRTLEVMRQQLTELYCDIFQHLRDESGNSYSPDEYALQQAADGAIFLVPRGTKMEATD